MWEQIRANRRRSIILIATMAIVLGVLGYAGGAALFGPDGAWLGVGVALLIWGIQLGAFAMSAESILLQGANARQLEREDSPRLFNIVDEMVLASGLGFTPRICLIDDPAPNAFAMGSKPDRSAIVVTTGLLHRLNRDELQGVIAHEIGHLKNRDVQFMTLAAVMLGSIVILSEIVWRSMYLSGRGRRRSESRGGGQAAAILAILAIVLAILAPLLAQLLYFASSRRREYLADASGAQFTRYPEGLASALEKISAARSNLSFASKATAPMFIVNPLYAASHEPNNAFATHPPTAERIRILRSMASAGLAEYEAAFRKTCGESVIGGETLRTAATEPIRVPSNEGPIETRSDTRDVLYRAHGYLPIQCSCGLQTSVPAGYERDEIRCVRCGNILQVPRAMPASAAPSPAVGPLEYRRTTGGWESFRCACGRTIQLSPGFAAPEIKCPDCGRSIVVTT